MRKLTGLKVVLLVVGLLAIAGAPPATAQLADPLSLAASGVLLPFFNDGTAGFVSILEVANPVVAAPFFLGNEVLDQNNPIHLVYFSQTCTIDGSFPDTFTPKQAKAYILSKPNLNVGPPNGLIALAQSFNGNSLNPLTYPVWSRVHWIDAKLGKLRELEPIILDTYIDTQLLAVGVPATNDEVWGSVGLCVSTTSQPTPTTGTATNNGFCWSPLRSGGSFVTPQEGGGLAASLILICPRGSIQSRESLTGGVFPRNLFPTIASRDLKPGFPATSNSISAPGSSASTILGRLYDDNEPQVANLRIPCDCLTVQAVKPLSQLYSTAPTVLNTYTIPVWYTELQSSNAVPDVLGTGGLGSGFFSFTGYWNLDIVGTPATLFHRLSNSSLDNIQPGNGGHPAPNGSANR